jgi:hypothetical protein
VLESAYGTVLVAELDIIIQHVALKGQGTHKCSVLHHQEHAILQRDAADFIGMGCADTGIAARSWGHVWQSIVL